MQADDGVEHDKRGAHRLRVLKQGRVVFNRGFSVLDCVIRDVSETGARIECEHAADIPRHFDLLFVADRMMVPCQMRWRRVPLVGAEFIGPAKETKIP